MDEYRCETCKDNSCEFHKSKKSISYMGSPITGIVHDFTLQKGCASHSDFQSERDKVLDKWQILRDWLQSADCGMFCSPQIIEWKMDDIDTLEKLREAGEP